jgi:hypothetical protein
MADVQRGAGGERGLVLIMFFKPAGQLIGRVIMPKAMRLFYFLLL